MKFPLSKNSFLRKGASALKITDIQAGDISISLLHPFKTALRTVDAVNDVVVRICTDEGAIGYGEAAPTAVITGDTRGSILTAIEDYIRPALLGMDILDLEGIMAQLHGCLAHNTTPKAAVDMAVYDLWAKAQGEPLFRLLGGARSSFETDLTISVNGVDEMVADSLEAIGRGFRILKIKVGKDAKADLDRIAAIRAAVGPDAELRLDANQGWTAEEAVRILTAIEDRELHPALVEQPVPAWDLDGLKFIRQRVATPILADESVFSVHDARRLLDMGAADMINIKLMKTGGIYKALEICRTAQVFGAQCMVGCMLESRLSVAAAAHLAAAQAVVTMADLDGPSLCAQDPYAGGPSFNGPHISMTGDIGIGVEGVPCPLWY